MAREQLPIAIHYIREDLEMTTRMLLTGLDEKEHPLRDDQIARLRRLVDDQGMTMEDLASQPFIVPDMTVEQGLTLHRGERGTQILFLGRGVRAGDPRRGSTAVRCSPDGCRTRSRAWDDVEALVFLVVGIFVRILIGSFV